MFHPAVPFGKTCFQSLFLLPLFKINEMRASHANMVVKITARLLKYLGFLKTGERKITVAHNCIYCKLVSFML